MHDFAWTASRRFLERRARFDDPGYPPVEMRLLLQPEHAQLAGRYLEATLGDLGDLRPAVRQILEDHLVTAEGSRTLRTEKELLRVLPSEKLFPVLDALEHAAILHAVEDHIEVSLLGGLAAEIHVVRKTAR